MNTFKKLKNYIKILNFSKIFSKSAEMSFYLTLSIFPSLIFLISVIAYIPNIDLIFKNKNILKFIPNDVLSVLQSLIDSAINNRSVNLILFSSLLAIWTFSKYIKSIIKAQNEVYEFTEKRNFLVLNLISVLYSIAFFTVIISTMILIVYGNKISIFLKELLNNNFVLVDFFNVIRFLIPILLMTFIFLNIFTFTPCGKLKYKQTITGSLITSVLWFNFSLIYAFYANHSSGLKEIYGSISTIIVLMSWLYFCSISIAIGYTINSIIFKRKSLSSN